MPSFATHCTFLATLLLLPSVPILAQAVAPPATPPAEPADPLDAGEDRIVVTANRDRGGVVGDVAPELQLDARDVRALGVSNLAELLAELAPQTRSGAGRGNGGPVVLLNGRRISGFSEIRDLPPEAIERVDVLPEEVALRYGYRADQRVVNFVLRRRFGALAAELEAGLATDGGRPAGEAEASLTRIRRDNRLTLSGDYERQGALLESERSIPLAAGEARDERPFRTLLPAAEALSLGATLARPLGSASAALSARYDADDRRARLGLLDDAPLTPELIDALGPLRRETASRTGRLGLSLNGDAGDWRWSVTGAGERATVRTETDRGLDEAGTAFFADRGRSARTSATADATASGPVLRLPAGPLRASLRLGGELLRFDARSVRATGRTDTDLSRDRAAAQFNLELPLTDSKDGPLSALGRLSLNLNGEVERLSDFGTLRSRGYGLNWTPFGALRLLLTVTDEKGAPTVQQLGDPVLRTPGVRVFDLSRSETALVERTDGGNSLLRADSRRALKLGATFRPSVERDLTFSVDYNQSRVRDVIAGFPAATPEIERAFPERFARDAAGVLRSVDARPVNFARADRRELRTGVNFSKRLGPALPARGPRGAAGGAGRGPGSDAAARGGRGSGGGPGGGFSGPGSGFGGGGRGGRLQLAFFHNWRLRDEVLIREGVPVLDLLDGSSVGSRGGQARHEFEAQAGLFRNGFGARLTGTRTGGSFLRGGASGADGEAANDLFFAPRTLLNLRFFANLGQQRDLVRRVPFLRGSRVQLSVDDLLNDRGGVRDRLGAVPLGYTPAELDPLGRSVRVSFRKLFL